MLMLVSSFGPKKFKVYQRCSFTEVAMQYQSRKAIRIRPRSKHGYLGKIMRSLMPDWHCFQKNEIVPIVYGGLLVVFFLRWMELLALRLKSLILVLVEMLRNLILFGSLCLTTPAEGLRICWFDSKKKTLQDREEGVKHLCLATETNQHTLPDIC